MGSTIREPIVAGMFYEGNERALRAQLAELFGDVAQPAGEALDAPVGLVAPHAGYPYSGAIAAEGYRWLAGQGTPDAAVILGTNHSGWGSPIAVSAADGWRSPLGIAPAVTELRDAMQGIVPADELCFQREHSQEVQLPFLQYVYGATVPCLALSVGTHDAETLRGVAEGVSQIVAGRGVALIASSDFTHYEPQDAVERKDRAAIDLAVQGDVDGFLDLVARDRLTICGAGAIALLLLIGKLLKWAPGRLLAYGTSGDTTGDRSSVVGYATMAWEGGMIR
jgi:AmmeMemoRadiSam system protein B